MVIPWNDGNLTDQSASTNAYHPEPIIFVHGITANRMNWAAFRRGHISLIIILW